MRVGRQWWSVSPVKQVQVTEENDKLGDTCHVRQMLEWKRTSSQRSCVFQRPVRRRELRTAPNWYVVALARRLQQLVSRSLGMVRGSIHDR